MIDRLGVWPLRALWFVLPVVAGPALGDALDPRSEAVQLVATTGLWGLWALTLLATLVPLPVTLTFARIVMPAAPLAVGWAVLSVDSETLDALALVGLGTTLLAAMLVLLATTGDAFVDGASYGNERRFALRPPAALLLGPIEAAWLAAVLGAVAGPLLLAAEIWMGGAVALLLGWPVVALAGRALHGLSRRWLIFVPAGFVVHDPLTLQDPVLIPRQLVARLGPFPLSDDRAPGDPAPTFGLLLAAELHEPLTIALRGEATDELHALDRILVAPSRPGAFLAEAGSRKLAVA